MARPTWTPPADKLEAIVADLRSGSGLHSTLGKHGVCAETFRKYRDRLRRGDEVPKEIAEFSAAIACAWDEQCQKWERRILTGEKQEGVTDNTRDLMWMLARVRKEYREKQEVGGIPESDGGEPVRLDPEKVIAQLNERYDNRTVEDLRKRVDDDLARLKAAEVAEAADLARLEGDEDGG